MKSLIHLTTLVGKVATSLMEDSTFLTSTYSFTFEDNTGALIIATIPRITPHSKYIAALYQFFPKNVTNGFVHIFKVARDQNKTDLVTKGLECQFQSLWTLLIGW